MKKNILFLILISLFAQNSSVFGMRASDVPDYPDDELPTKEEFEALTARVHRAGKKAVEAFGGFSDEKDYLDGMRRAAQYHRSAWKSVMNKRRGNGDFAHPDQNRPPSEDRPIPDYENLYTDDDDDRLGACICCVL